MNIQDIVMFGAGMLSFTCAGLVAVAVDEMRRLQRPDHLARRRFRRERKRPGWSDAV
jgi:hypothetical protein